MEPIFLITDSSSILCDGLKVSLSRAGHKILYFNITDNAIEFDGRNVASEDENIIFTVRTYNISCALFVPSILSDEIKATDNIDSKIANIIKKVVENGVNKIILLSSIWAKPDEPRGRHHFLWQIEELIRHLDTNIEVLRLPLVYGVKGSVIHSLIEDSIRRFIMLVPKSTETSLLFVDDLAGIISNKIQSVGAVRRARYIFSPKRVKMEDIVRCARLSAQRRGPLLVVNDIFYRLLSKFFGIKKRDVYIRVKRDFFRDIDISWNGFDDDFSYSFKDAIDWVDTIAVEKM